MSSHASSPLTVAVLGGGSFGTAIANIVATNGHQSKLWVRDPERAAKCQQARENEAYLPGYALHDGLTFYSDLQACVADADLVVALALYLKLIVGTTLVVSKSITSGVVLTTL